MYLFMDFLHIHIYIYIIRICIYIYSFFFDGDIIGHSRMNGMLMAGAIPCASAS